MKKKREILAAFLLAWFCGAQIKRAQAWPIVLIGDTQRTTWMERLLGREDVAEAAPFLLSEIATRKPSAFFHLGDAVACGGCKRAWRKFEKIIAPIRQLEIPMYLAFGNHEYWFSDARMKASVARIFGHTMPHHYTVKHDSVAFVIVDSNYRKMSRSEWKAQAL